MDETINPKVNSEAEFLEIVNDFGDPLELIREAISNALDNKATYINVAFSVDEIDGESKLVIILEDDGNGMTEGVLREAFWGLGYSTARGDEEKIGEKGHGTKIYLRSELVEVWTSTVSSSFYSYCDRPHAALFNGRLHSPKIRSLERANSKPGTKIRIVGYNANERSRFIRAIVRDYVLWFTKIGSTELEFGIDRYKDFKVKLKCISDTDFEEIKYGHVFPAESCDLDKLFKQHSENAADYYVKRFKYEKVGLPNHPEIQFDAIIYVEGDSAKKDYNKMIKGKKDAQKGSYKVSDRYGIWLSKDYIPIETVNSWISGFGTGSNSFVMLHGFINCQKLKLTANRGTIANTNPKVIEELKTEVSRILTEIDIHLRTAGVYTLRSWQDEEKTLQQEKAEYERRIKDLKNRKVVDITGNVMLEPRNESELFGLFVRLYGLRPDLFDFEPLDYNTTKGIDIIGRNKTNNTITEGDHWYIELKYLLAPKFNHAFKYLRFIVCWEFDRSIVISSTEFVGVEETDVRKLVTAVDDGKTKYFLDNPKKGGVKIEVIRLKEFIKERLGLEFITQP